MKAFAFGALVGALICFTVMRVTAPQVLQTTAPAQVPAASVEPVVNEPHQGPSCPEAPVSAQRVEPTKRLERPVTGERRDLQASLNGPSSVNQRCITIETLSEEEAHAIFSRAHQLRQQREQAKKDAEPKDPGWAYSTEMLIRQHIESQLPADRYSKLHIECRTTFCELRMTGTGTEAREIADRLVKEIVRQPWSDIVHKGGGGGSNGEDWHIESEWYRPRTESERKLWLRARDSQ